MNNKEIFNYCKKVIREHSDMKVFNDEKQVGYGTRIGLLYYDVIVDKRCDTIRLEHNDHYNGRGSYTIEFKPTDDIERLRVLQEILDNEFYLGGLNDVISSN